MIIEVKAGGVDKGAACGDSGAFIAAMSASIPCH